MKVFKFSKAEAREVKRHIDAHNNPVIHIMYPVDDEEYEHGELALIDLGEHLFSAVIATSTRSFLLFKKKGLYLSVNKTVVEETNLKIFDKKNLVH